MNQVGLKGMLEFTAACGFLFAMGSSADIVSYAIAFIVVSIWSLRIRNSSVRWWIFSWLVACGSICIGLACLEHAFLETGPDEYPDDRWILFGCAAMVWSPLAVVIGFVFLVDWVGRVREKRAIAQQKSAPPSRARRRPVGSVLQ